VYDDAAPRLRRAPPQRENDLLASGFARWYRVEPSRAPASPAPPAANGNATIEHTVRGYAAARRLVVTTARDVIMSVTVAVAAPDDAAARPFFAEFVTSFLRTLEPDDRAVRAITARLRARVGLGADDRSETASIESDDVVAVLLGTRRDARASLDHGDLRVARAGDAVDLVWLRRERMP
jgi:hypothetical protein